jgi:hypothetical protein
VSFPYQGRYTPATRPDLLEDDGDDSDGAKDGASSDWFWFPASSSDFGTCPENYSASISQGVSFRRRPVGPSASLRVSDRVDNGHRPCCKHLLEMRPIKYVLSGRLLILFSLQLLHLHYSSVALLQEVPLHKATKRVLSVLSEPVELTPFSGRLSPPAAFSVQSLSFNQEAFRVFRQKTDAAGVCANSLLQVVGWRLPP